MDERKDLDPKTGEPVENSIGLIVIFIVLGAGVLLIILESDLAYTLSWVIYLLIIYGFFRLVSGKNKKKKK